MSKEQEKTPIEAPLVPPTTSAFLESMKALEARTEHGAPNRELKSQMLDASDVAKRHPDLHLRWLNGRNPEQMRSRLADGYAVLPTEMGGRRIGDGLVLAAIPRTVARKRINILEQETHRQLNAHKDEHEAEIEAIARMLRDEKGLKISAGRMKENLQTMKDALEAASERAERGN